MSKSDACCIDGFFSTSTTNVDNSFTQKSKDTSPLLRESLIPQSNTTVTSDDGTAVPLAVNVDSSSTSQEHIQNPESTTPPMSTSLVPQSNTTMTSDDGIAASLTVIVDSTSQEHDPESTTPPKSTTKDSGMDVDAPASATHQASDPVPMEVDQEIEEEPTNVVAVAAPAWLTAYNMDDYLRKCSNEKAWQVLVQSFYKFEERNAIKGVRQ
jgi:hypothetical protein